MEDSVSLKAEKKPNRYNVIIEKIFFDHFTPGATIVRFTRDEFTATAKLLGIEPPKNLGDVVYSYKFRAALPEAIIKQAPEGTEWVIVNRGKAIYEFQARGQARIIPDSMLVKIKIPDSTPGIVAMYTKGDEQALLTRLRYNRILDVFTGVMTHSLQNHLRTSIKGVGQIETDELYVGLDKKGAHYVFPVQAKGGKDEIGVVQIEQDFALCKERFPELICRAIAAQFLDDGGIAVMEFILDENAEVRKVAEQHYLLVNPKQLTPEEIARYRQTASY
ncbi:hypothetical protein M0L20_29655 [Spirosoma sp. RP8]|uniref:Endonuclease n=1 Tax=Spirosoma liriopis TaxID=2937440 RepID=A0ABT0HV41_9BACT|nr:hypothetical protein [Spirosoma liriopis]MCK8496069.1 hypothetical protein [Spirosoma liriopis]